MQERPTPYSLRVQGGPEHDVNALYLRQAFNDTLSASGTTGHRTMASHAFYGDLLVKLIAVEHLEHRFRVAGETTGGMSDHELLQPYVTRESQAAFFDFVVLQVPQLNNHDFSAHTKADKVEALISYLDLKRGPGLGRHARKTAKRQLDAIYRWLLQHGDKIEVRYVRSVAS
ncbi:hypothetical protein JKP88DRAFT_247635 [Tribonema minus]|uniref:Uncharacterized protein n=1 Tax=Tribonema minus TaxID=303371 RepID=A0A835YRB5_9STRA|nr:hypothetical protein JKP88DRAFT_247635 [Tribonema minus]